MGCPDVQSRKLGQGKGEQAAQALGCAVLDLVGVRVFDG